MANDNFTQAALAADAHFRRRVTAALSSVAWTVLGEDPGTANHANRIGYAQHVTRALDTEASIILPSFVMRPNLINAATTYVFDFVDQIGQCVSAAPDDALTAQLAADWDAMAAAAGYVTAP